MFFIVLSLGVIAYIFNKFKDSNTLSNLYEVNAFYIQSIPYLLGIVFCLIVLLQYHKNPSLYTIIGALLGVLFGELFELFNDNGVWIDELITTDFTMIDLKIVCVMFFLVIGLIVTAYRSD